ncbi:uncharacterized protein LOC117119832 [Anneissia japonica]|uniref:uncharacterized protein LOC117119832 n=1 Tax=Anneissia japonica TaxID=1529436 RepID=UPI001425AA79|nr:uncharacterized protein LOC117119832 [Anneissia japonica]
MHTTVHPTLHWIFTIFENDYVRKLADNLGLAYAEATRTADGVRLKQKATYDKKAKQSEFENGCQVLIANKGIHGRRKIADRWENQLYTVVSKFPDQPVYVVRSIDGNKERTVHRNLIIPCTFSTLDERDEETEQFTSFIPPPPEFATYSSEDSSSEDSSSDFENRYNLREIIRPPVRFGH